MFKGHARLCQEHGGNRTSNTVAHAHRAAQHAQDMIALRSRAVLLVIEFWWSCAAQEQAGQTSARAEAARESLLSTAQSRCDPARALRLLGQ
jgi:hypothetical protein